jgi:hypothetical protein
MITLVRLHDMAIQHGGIKRITLQEKDCHIYVLCTDDTVASWSICKDDHIPAIMARAVIYGLAQYLTIGFGAVVFAGDSQLVIKRGTRTLRGAAFPPNIRPLMPDNVIPMKKSSSSA